MAKKPEQTFQSTLPVWGATMPLPALPDYRRDFNPRSPCGERPAPTSRTGHPADFNPRSPCGERRLEARTSVCGRGISIHAPRVGSDVSSAPSMPWPGNFNPRSPCGERPNLFSMYRLFYEISIHAPRVGSDAPGPSIIVSKCISIHAPRVGSDETDSPEDKPPRQISIHAPRVGSDATTARASQPPSNFNPRSPCGERRNREAMWQETRIFQSTLPVWGATELIKAIRAALEFQSTLPVWGATLEDNWVDIGLVISIHAPRVGSDCGTPPARRWPQNFNPRSPCGERPDPPGVPAGR